MVGAASPSRTRVTHRRRVGHYGEIDNDNPVWAEDGAVPIVAGGAESVPALGVRDGRGVVALVPLGRVGQEDDLDVGQRFPVERHPPFHLGEFTRAATGGPGHQRATHASRTAPRAQAGVQERTQSLEMTSPFDRVTNCWSVMRGRESPTNRTLPSPNTRLAPPVWLLE